MIEGAEDIGSAAGIGVLIPIRFSSVGLGAVYFVVCGGTVEAKIVGSYSDDGSVALVKPIQVQVSFARPCMVE